jgi:hypothetical protein
MALRVPATLSHESSGASNTPKIEHSTVKEIFRPNVKWAIASMKLLRDELHELRISPLLKHVKSPPA